MSVNVSTKQFKAALKQYQQATGKDMADVLNRAGANIAMRALSFTPQAKPSQIDRYSPDRSALMHALATKGTKHGKAKKGEGNKALAWKIYNSRKRGRGYIRAGWVEAAKDMGAKPRMKVKPGGRAAKGYGRKASRIKLQGDIYNFSEGAELVGLNPLKRAIVFVAADMKTYADKKLAKTARRFSGR